MSIKKLGIKLLKGVSIVLAIVILFAGASYITSVFRDKDIPGKSIGLQTAEQDIDVLFFGSSHIGIISPVELWKDYGIVSYNMYNDGNSMKRNLAALRLALEYTNPKLIVLDVDGWWIEPEFYEEPGTYHYALGNFPLSLKKIEVVKQLTDDKSIQKELLFDFYRYHSRWQEIEREDFIPQEDTYMGAKVVLKTAEMPEIIQIPQEAVFIDEKSNPSTLVEFIEECRSRNIEIMCTCLPFGASEKEQMRFHSLNDILAQYEVPFVNFFDMPLFVSNRYDFYNKGHLNTFGGIKIENALAEIIKEEFSIPDRRQDSLYADWYEIEAAYDEKIRGKIANGLGQAEMLRIFAWDEFCGEIYFDGSRPIDDKTEMLLREIFPNQKRLLKLEEAIQKGSAYLLIYNRQEDLLQEYVGEEAMSLIGELEGTAHSLICIRDASTMEMIAENQYE